MKKLFCSALIIILSGIIGSESVSAQRTNREEFRFFYITTNSTINTRTLTKFLQEEFDDAIVDDNACAVFFLPESSSRLRPNIVKVHLEGENPNDFPSFLDRISSSPFTHDANPDKDIPAMIEIFDQEGDFITSSGALRYDSFTLYYIVHPDTDLQDGIVPKLYFTFDLPSLPEDSFQLQIMHQQDDDFQYDEKRPFGNWDFCPNFIITTYE